MSIAHSASRPLYHFDGSRCWCDAMNAARFAISVSTGSVLKNSRYIFRPAPNVTVSRFSPKSREPHLIDLDVPRSFEMSDGRLVRKLGGHVLDLRRAAQGDSGRGVARKRHAGNDLDVDQPLASDDRAHAIVVGRPLKLERVPVTAGRASVWGERETRVRLTPLRTALLRGGAGRGGVNEDAIATPPCASQYSSDVPSTGVIVRYGPTLLRRIQKKNEPSPEMSECLSTAAVGC